MIMVSFFIDTAQPAAQIFKITSMKRKCQGFFVSRGRLQIVTRTWNMLLRERPCAQRDIDFHSSIPYAVIFVVFTARFKDGIKQQRVSRVTECCNYTLSSCLVEVIRKLREECRTTTPEQPLYPMTLRPPVVSPSRNVLETALILHCRIDAYFEG